MNGKVRAAKKQAYEIYANEPLLFAGIWDEWNGKLTSCAMITTQASEQLACIHKRMPVMLKVEQAKQWLDMKTPINNLRQLFETKFDISVHY